MLALHIGLTIWCAKLWWGAGRDKLYRGGHRNGDCGKKWVGYILGWEVV